MVALNQDYPLKKTEAGPKNRTRDFFPDRSSRARQIAPATRITIRENYDSPRWTAPGHSKFANGAFSWTFQKTTASKPPPGWHPPLWLPPAKGEVPVHIAQNGNSVDITIRIRFSGRGARDSVQRKFKRGIEETWTGQFGRFDVKTTVLLVTGGGRFFDIDVPQGNRDAVMHGIGGTTGRWPNLRPAWTAAHEIAHGEDFELPDRWGRNSKGWEGNIMASRNGVPWESDIEMILETYKRNHNP